MVRRILAAGLAALGVSVASADFMDNFESYADTASMLAPGAWGDLGAVPPAGVVLQTSGGNPGQYMEHPGGQTARHSFAAMMTSDATPLVWQFDFLDSGNSSNRRITNGLRVGTGLPILEMGIHNNNDNPETPDTTDVVAGYAIRTVGVGGPGAAGGWMDFPGNPAIRAGWHRFTATMTSTSMTFDLDFNSDGSIDATRTIATSDTSAIGWNALNIGGPSGVSSAAGGGGFDNVSIVNVPEPSALALLGLGAAAMIRRRR